MTKYWKDNCLKQLDLCREYKDNEKVLLERIRYLTEELESVKRVQVSLYNMLDYSNHRNDEQNTVVKELIKATDNSEMGRVADCLSRLRVIANKVS